MSVVTAAIDSIDMTADARAMTPKTCRAARVLLEMDQIELAKRAGVAVQTVRNYEGAETKPSHETWLRIKRALEKAGIQFIDENGGGPGVRLRKP
jgi:DNA-binding transcriptional regulator YiaG